MGRKRVVMNRYKLGRKVGTTESRKDSLVNYLISFTVNFVVMFFCLFNYSNQNQSLPESIFEALGKGPHKFKELWTNSSLEFKNPLGSFTMKPYQFLILST